MTIRRTIGRAVLLAGLSQAASWSGVGYGADRLGPNQPIDPQKWMAGVSDSTPLNLMSLPGTHETCAHRGGESAECNNLSLADQLNSGLRVFDIRLRHFQDTFPIHHGRVFQDLNFTRDVRDVCQAFLAKNPSETIVLIIKKEYTEAEIHSTFEQLFRSCLAGSEDFWYLDNTIPTLGQVRRKIVLIRRFNSDPLDLRLMSWGDGSGVPTSGRSLVLIGIDNKGLLHIRIFDPSGSRVTETDETKVPSSQAGAVSTLKGQLPGLLPPHVLTEAEKAQLLSEATVIVGRTLGIDAGENQWKDDTTFEIKNTAHLKVQDDYSFSSGKEGKKWTLITELLDETLKRPDRSVWYINETSASANSKTGGDFPRTFANYENPRLKEYLSTQGPGCVGTILMDFPNIVSNLTSMIIYRNLGDQYWSQNQTIGNLSGPDAKSDAAPALVTFGNLQVAVYKGESSDNNLRMMTSVDGMHWSGNEEIRDQPGNSGNIIRSNKPPALAVLNDRLVMVHKGEHSNDLYLSSYDGRNWSGNKTFHQVTSINPKSDEGVALVTFRDKIHMVHKGESKALYHSVFDGKSWSGNKTFAESTPIKPESSEAPALAAFNTTLYMVHKGANSTTLYLSTFDGTTWSGNKTFKEATGISPESAHAPTLTDIGGRLYMIYRGASDDHLYQTTFDGSTWSGNTLIESFSGIAPASNERQASAAFRNKLYLLYKGAQSNTLYQSSLRVE
jgi:hypothetical protein